MTSHLQHLNRTKEETQKIYDNWCNAPTVSVVCSELLDYCTTHQSKDSLVSPNKKSGTTNIFLKDPAGGILHNLLHLHHKDKKDRVISKIIDKAIQEEWKLNSQTLTMNVILLGRTHSGRMTLMKQIQRIYDETPFDISPSRFLRQLRQLCTRELSLVVNCLKNRQVNHESVVYLSNANLAEWTPPMIAHAKSLMDFVRKEDKFDILYRSGVDPKIEWVIDNLERFQDVNFVPTVEDVLRVEPRLLQILPKISPSMLNDDTNNIIQSNLIPTSNNVPVELSADILMEITKYSSIKTICALSQVCKHFHKALSSDVVWERLLESDFGTSSRNRSDGPKDYYKLLYAMRHNGKSALQSFAFPHRETYKLQLVAVPNNGERRKWIHQFEGAAAIIFMVDLANSFCPLYEDETTYSLHEDLMLFDEIVNSRWWYNTSYVYVIFNKVDVFEQKQLHRNFRSLFSDWTQGNDWYPFLQDQFVRRSHNNRKTIRFFKMNALDLDQVKTFANEITMVITASNDLYLD